MEPLIEKKGQNSNHTKGKGQNKPENNSQEIV